MKNTNKILKNGMQIEQLEDRLEMAASAGSSVEIEVGYEVPGVGYQF